jgi:hypothetical protein
MKNGSVSFTSGKIYEINGVQEFIDGEDEYFIRNDRNDNHTLLKEDIAEHFLVTERKPVLLHRYECGCIGIPVDSKHCLLFKACDGEMGEYDIGYRDMPDKDHYPLTQKEENEIIRRIGRLISRGYAMTDLARVVKTINKETSNA